MKHLFITIYFVLISFLFRGYKGEYYIKQSNNPSYLYKHFEEVEESVFPREIKINMSLSTLSGIIIYSIDQNMNQLIVSVSDSKESTLTIEFNKKPFHLSMSQLCGCRQCRYEVIEMQIRMREDINIWCNERGHKTLEYGLSNELNEYYPNPYSKDKKNQFKQNAAHLWIGNHQQYGDIFPNGNQISGCIFNISYNGKNVAFQKIAGDIGLQCRKACKEGICNGGVCFETYDEEPVCDCTRTFKNGRYCNDMMTRKNFETTTQYFMFKMFKLSWMTSSNDIFSFKNKWRKIRLYRKESVLMFQYKNMLSGGFNTIGVLSENYIPNEKYILVVTFLTKRINIWLCHNNTSESTMIITDVSLPNEIFTSLVLRSGKGIIDIVWKVSEKFPTWSYLDIRQLIYLESEQLINFTNTSMDTVHCQDNTNIYLAGNAIFIVACLSFIIYWRIRRRYREPKKYEVLAEIKDPIPLSKGSNMISVDQELKLRMISEGKGRSTI